MKKNGKREIEKGKGRKRRETGQAKGKRKKEDFIFYPLVLSLTGNSAFFPSIAMSGFSPFK